MPTIREQLEQGILLGEFPRNTRLDEQQLAARFAVSRTPIREALKQLVASGLLEHKPNRGVFIRTPSVRELLEMFEVMAELESFCGRLAARRVNQDNIHRLTRLNDACLVALASGDHDRYYHANEKLHMALYELSGNHYLAQQSASLHKRLQPYRRLQLRVPYRMRQSMSEHQDIVKAIAAGDAEAAAACMRAHVSIQGEKFNDLIADLKLPDAV